MVENKFIADVMLGRLAKWLRIAGIDVLYNNKFTDEQLIAISEIEKRTILTRDKQLAFDKKAKEIIFIENELIDKQIKEFFEKTNMKLKKPFTRCIICNQELEKIKDKTEVRNKVPAYTYLTKKEFSICKKCGKIYWKGTHRDNMKKKLDELIFQLQMQEINE
jgi:uncharacterized protein with PIN domain